MSKENAEIVRLWIASAGAGPAGVKAAVAEFFDANVDYYPAGKFAEAEPCHGLEEFSQFLTRWRETWSRFEWVVQEVIEVGDDRVLVCANLRAEGRGSGLKLEGGDVYFCVWLRHGRIFRQEDHLTLSGALHALGLEGENLEAAGLSD
jgi:SnoaL-like domain